MIGPVRATRRLLPRTADNDVVLARLPGSPAAAPSALLHDELFCGTLSFRLWDDGVVRRVVRPDVPSARDPGSVSDYRR